MSCFNGHPCKCSSSEPERPPIVADILPSFTSDVSSGFVQALNGRSFQGQSGPVTLSSAEPETFAYIFLSNPRNSHVLIAVNNITLVNFTGGIVQFQTTLTPLPTLATMPSTNVENTNCSCSFIRPCAQIISLSTTTELALDPFTYTNLIPALSSFELDLNGSTIIGPGCSLAILATALTDDITGTILANFRWFEICTR
ncbi:MAG: hypothetical protein E7256_16620 [Lachnospiraceae bacterium]|nr:hypothetical protein [Lachnospiraceae bacterium]